MTNSSQTVMGVFVFLLFFLIPVHRCKLERRDLSDDTDA